MRGTRKAAIALVVATAAFAGGCAGSPASATLADSKGLVQLVRNEAGQRLPTDDVQEVKLVDDGSEACDDDPQGLQRRWSSSLLVTLLPAASDSLEATYSDLIDSFVGNGWSEVTYGGGGAATLKKPGTDATIAFNATKADADAATPPAINITIRSACVATGGAESDEVQELEALAAED